MPTFPNLPEAVAALRALPGFTSFDDPGAEYEAVERAYKVDAARLVRAELASEDAKLERARGEAAALRRRLRTYVAENGYSNLMGWRDVPMAFGRVQQDQASDAEILRFFEALHALDDAEPDVAAIADRLAAAIAGPTAADLKSHMWAAITCLCGMLRPDLFMFVKPQRTDAFFRRMGSPYVRPKPFTGAAYVGLMAECEELWAALAAQGLRPRDMIDLQSFVWIATEKPVAGEQKRPTRELLREAAEALAPENPGGFTSQQICDYLDEQHPRPDERPWTGNMVVPGDYAVWADTGELCSPSTTGEAAYPKFLTCLDRRPPYRYQLRTEAQAPVVVAGDVYTSFRDQGLWLPDEVITTYALALKTKPFVILTGISGTGKTKIAQLFAAYMAPPTNDGPVEQPENTETTFYIRASGIAFEKQRYVRLNAKTRDYFELGPKGQTVDVQIRTDDGGQFVAGLLDVGFTDESQRDTRLRFKNELWQWAKTRIKLGDILELERQGDHYRLRKYAPAQAVATRHDRHAFIAVRPDWTDNRGLLGYYNPLLDIYEPTEALKLMLRAARDPHRPYFLILDEMNLAKVEHYFSDFLSCLESRRLDEAGQPVQEAIILHDRPEALEFTAKDGTYEIPPRLEIPWNLYVTGTVNVDETTYMFSPKVLDRANTIEFDHVDLAAYGGLGDSTAATTGFRLRPGFALQPLALPHRDGFLALPASLRLALAGLNDVLQAAHLHFGYRVANEIAAFLTHAQADVGPDALHVALDLQLLQKVLPKLHGPRAKLEGPLRELLTFCEAGGFPRTAAKLVRMQRTLAAQGYASFVS